MNSEKEKKSLLNRIKNDKKFQYVTVGILIIVAVVVAAVSYFVKPSATLSAASENDYVTILEKKLSSVLSDVEGAGKVSVIITVESGMETVIAMKTTTTETANGTEITETPIVVNGKTVVLKELYPKIVGVLIVAEGAKSLAVLNKIQQATVSLLNINVNCIEILSMK